MPTHIASLLCIVCIFLMASSVFTNKQEGIARKIEIIDVNRFI